ncbi:polysaccharide pyruvyl transferase family protein [Saltatorellus ferox]|uniref:polysaccharide pyruvyl transferase family protein n=1 Tax=Saltatorellus ferox TaxID=2528018 RepID=UPI003AF340BC
MNTSSTPHFCLFGAAPGTNNLGVDALSQGVLGGIAARCPGATFTVFDYRRGQRSGSFVMTTPDASERSVSYDLLGANHSRRMWRGDTLKVMQIAGRLRLPNAGVEAMKRATAVLDLSGGDSFTDLYGRHRFETVSLPKRLSLDLGVPLVLLPQTYGPFVDAGMRAEAADLCRGASSAWARDARSFEVLKSLLGDTFDASRHRLGVDVAFGMRPRRRPGGISPILDRWIEERDGSNGPPVVGLNVSGLVWGSPERAKSYGFILDYRSLVTRFLTWLTTSTDARVALVPHVIEPEGHYESDPQASRELLETLPKEHRDRVTILSPPFEPAEIKHEIGRLDWFNGTRMHATIAALSTGVPASAIAYSPKFLGVFEIANQSPGVADPTTLSEEEALQTLRSSYEARASSRTPLAAALPKIESTLNAQFEAILSAS